MDNIVPLVKGEVDRAVVARLEMLLKEARKGSLFHIAFVGLCNDGRIIECVTLGESIYETLGIVHVLADRVSGLIREDYENEHRE